MPNNQITERMDELIRAVDEIFVGKIPSEDDLYGIHQVLVERRDAEIVRQSVTDEAVQVALTWFEELDTHEFVRRIKAHPDYKATMPDEVVKTILTALRQYQKPTDAFCDFPVDEEKEANKKFEERCTDIGVNILDERKQPDTETQQDICHLEIMATNLMGHVQDGNKLAVAQVKALDAAITALEAKKAKHCPNCGRKLN